MPVSTVRREGSRAKILHVEDNPENRMLVRAILEAEGYTIIDAEDGLAGIEAAIREEPALILLDVNLPAVDGYEVVAIEPDRVQMKHLSTQETNWIGLDQPGEGKASVPSDFQTLLGGVKPPAPAKPVSPAGNTK